MTLATMAGQPIAADGAVSWGLSTGTQPYTAEFSFAARHAQRIEQASRGFTPVQLVIGTRSYENIFVVRRVPSTHPYLWRYLCADLRILWQMVWIGPRTYNHAKKSGDVRWVGGALNSFTPSSAIDAYAYRLGTLDNGKRWTAFRTIADVVQALQAATAYRLAWRTEGAPIWNGRQTPILNLTIDDQGDVALARALGHAAGVDVIVTPAGTVRPTDRLDGSEAAVIRSGPPPIVGSTIPALVTRQDTRPQRVDVIFQVEAEVRFDFVGNSGRPTGAERRLENVMRVLQQEISSGTGTTWAYSTWVTIDQMITASGTLPKPATAAGPLTQARIQRGFAADTLTSEYAGGVSGYLAADPDWQLLIAELMRRWRQTMRLPREWLDRTLAWRGTRGSILDPQYSERANASVFTDWSYRIPQDRWTQAAAEGGHTHLNVIGYDASTALCKAAPAEVKVESEDLGIFTVDLTSNRWRQYGAIYPCAIEELPDRRFRRVGPGDVFLDEQLVCTEDHAVGVILTLTPLPGTHNRYVMSVSPGQVAGNLGPGVTLGQSLGPVREVRVEDRLAIVGWTDGTAETTERLFGFHGAAPSKAAVDALLVNREEMAGLALAAATREYARHADRIEGSYTVAGTPDIVPRGRIEAVISTIDASGLATTTILLPGEPPRLETRALLDEATRRRLGYQLGPDR